MTYIRSFNDNYHFFFLKKGSILRCKTSCYPLFLTHIIMNAQYNSEKHLIDLEEFASQVARCMNCPNQPEKAVQALKDIFGIIRNRLAFAESLEFINLLPLPLKAIYLDGWHIGENTSVQLHSMEELIDEIIANRTEENNWYHSNRDELRNILHTVFQLIGAHVVAAEVGASVSFLPKDMQYFLMQNHIEIENSADTDTSIWLS